jgi:hypothetical protein
LNHSVNATSDSAQTTDHTIFFISILLSRYWQAPPESRNPRLFGRPRPHDVVVPGITVPGKRTRSIEAGDIAVHGAGNASGFMAQAPPAQAAQTICQTAEARDTVFGQKSSRRAAPTQS